jgi:nitroreductase
MLAARALGIGSVPTTLHAQVLERVYALLHIPAEMEFHLCIPLGYPRGQFGPTQRRPTAETTYLNHWGTAVPWATETAAKR